MYSCYVWRFKKYNIIVDGGDCRTCFQQLLNNINAIKSSGNQIDLMILTHVDIDHIDGFLRLFMLENFDFSVIKEIWFNFGKDLNDLLNIGKEYIDLFIPEYDTEIGWGQGVSLDNLLEKNKIKKQIVMKFNKFNIGNAIFTILSPTKNILKEFVKQGSKSYNKEETTNISYLNDYNKSVLELNDLPQDFSISLNNKSSIAFLFEYENFKILFLGDSDPRVITQSLSELGYSEDRKLKLDVCKISHHASRHNTTNDLIKMIECSNYIISSKHTTNGRPSKECLSRIIYNSDGPVTFYCNYELLWHNIFTNEEIEEYNIKFDTIDELILK